MQIGANSIPVSIYTQLCHAQIITLLTSILVFLITIFTVLLSTYSLSKYLNG
jgi:hypothetical protein